tara:strand:+ start:446 stop:685 length:240 start_codon:yes stop_codon:yes gene_type:complete
MKKISIDKLHQLIDFSSFKRDFEKSENALRKKYGEDDYSLFMGMLNRIRVDEFREACEKEGVDWRAELQDMTDSASRND